MRDDSICELPLYISIPCVLAAAMISFSLIWPGCVMENRYSIQETEQHYQEVLK